MIKRFVLGTVLALMVLLLGGFWLAFFSARPPLMLDPAILEGDGSVIDYCALPQLSGQGKTAAEIPKGNTPGCGYDHFPLPILAGCTEPLPEDADDLRGLWIGVEGKVGHVERIEQRNVGQGGGAAVTVPVRLKRPDVQECNQRYGAGPQVCRSVLLDRPSCLKTAR